MTIYCITALIDLQTFNIYLSDGLGLLILLLCSALMSGTEVAFFSLSHKQITQCKNSRDPGARRVIKLLSHPRRLLATVLILNNMINVGFVMLSTYLLWKIVGTEEIEGVVLFVYTLISTTAIVLFGEVIPKIYANQNNLLFAKRMTGFLQVARLVLYPLSSILLSLGRLFNKSLLQERSSLSMDKLGRALELTTIKETSAGEQATLKGVLNFSTLTARQTMQPRTAIKAVEIDTNFHQLIDFINKAGYSRLPVYKETIDKIEGILSTKDLIPHINKKEDFNWQALLHKCFFVPENKKIDALLLEFQKKGVRMAIVVDEYGGTSGLLAMEDIIEEIVGDIVDEFDQEEMLYTKLDEQSFVFEGRMSLHDFCKAIGEDMSTFEKVKGESESLAGLLLELHGRLPIANEKFVYQNFNFTIVAADPRKIKKVKVEIMPKKPLAAW